MEMVKTGYRGFQSSAIHLLPAEAMALDSAEAVFPLSLWDSAAVGSAWLRS